MEFIRENKKELIKLAIYIIVVLLIIFIVNNYFYSLIRVNGESMDPALRNKDIIIIDKTIDEYNRYDIVAFKYMYDNSDIYLKRIIGMPGETIEIKDNVIYINGVELKEYYGVFSDMDKSPDLAGYFSDYPSITLAMDEYFVIGDNRYVSDDSRNFGPIKEETLVGRAVFRMWKFDGIGSLENQ